MPVDPEKLRVWQLTDAAWYPINKAMVPDESVTERRCCLLVCAKVTEDELWIVGDHPFVNLTISSDEPAPTLAWNHFDDDVHQKILDEVAKVAHDASHENWQGFEGLRALAFQRPPSLPALDALAPTRDLVLKARGLLAPLEWLDDKGRECAWCHATRHTFSEGANPSDNHHEDCPYRLFMRATDALK